MREFNIELVKQLLKEPQGKTGHRSEIVTTKGSYHPWGLWKQREEDGVIRTWSWEVRELPGWHWLPQDSESNLMGLVHL